MDTLKTKYICHSGQQFCSWRRPQSKPTFLKQGRPKPSCLSVFRWNMVQARGSEMPLTESENQSWALLDHGKSESCGKGFPSDVPGACSAGCNLVSGCQQWLCWCPKGLPWDTTTFHGIWRTPPHWHHRGKKTPSAFATVSSTGTVKQEREVVQIVWVQFHRGTWPCGDPSGQNWEKRGTRALQRLQGPSSGEDGGSPEVWVVVCKEHFSKTFQPGLHPGLTKMHRFFTLFYPGKCFSTITLILHPPDITLGNKESWNQKKNSHRQAGPKADEHNRAAQQLCTLCPVPLAQDHPGLPWGTHWTRRACCLSSSHCIALHWTESALIHLPGTKINCSSLASNNVREEGHSHSCLLKQMATVLQGKAFTNLCRAVSSPAGMEERRRSRTFSSPAG